MKHIPGVWEPAKNFAFLAVELLCLLKLSAFSFQL